MTGHKGAWLGVEWDDTQRGKHDGSVNGERYFATASTSGGSMIRPGRLEPRHSLRSAIEYKYILTADYAVDSRLMAETQRKLHASIFEIVGMDKLKEKQSHWDDLRLVSIQSSGVYMAGILTQLSNLIELDLTDSLISDWGTIADIMRQVPSIRQLNLSKNRFEAPSDEQVAAYRTHFDGLRALNLRDCGLREWPQLLHIARMWPQLKQLSVQENQLSDLASLPSPADDVVGECFEQLESLDLSQNGICDFAQLIELGRLSTLRALNLADNQLSAVELPDCEPDRHLDALFGGLCEINLKGNPIRDRLATFNELDKLGALQSLLWTVDNDIGFEQTFADVVGRMSSLRMLNGMQLGAIERRGAEYELWKAFGAEWLATEAYADGRQRLNRRVRAYHRLVKSERASDWFTLPEHGRILSTELCLYLSVSDYGPPDICVPVKKVSNLINIRMYTVDSSGQQTTQPLTKRVSRKMSVQALQGVALKLLGAALASTSSSDTSAAFEHSHLPRLSYLDRSRADLKIPMDNPAKSLDYYSLEDGDSVIVNW